MALRSLKTDSYALYHERQSFIRSHFFAQILFFALIVFSWWVFIQRIVLGIPVELVGTDTDVIILWFVAGLFVPALLLVMRLDIEVTQVELRFQYVPFHLSPRIIPHSSIVQVDTESYHLPVTSGSGIKYHGGFVSYTVSGNEGVCIVYLTPAGKEKKIFLGSQSALELEQVLLRAGRR